MKARPSSAFGTLCINVSIFGGKCFPSLVKFLKISCHIPPFDNSLCHNLAISLEDEFILGVQVRLDFNNIGDNSSFAYPRKTFNSSLYSRDFSRRYSFQSEVELEIYT